MASPARSAAASSKPGAGVGVLGGVADCCAIVGVGVLAGVADSCVMACVGVGVLVGMGVGVLVGVGPLKTSTGYGSTVL